MKTRLIIIISAIVLTLSCSKDESYWIIGTWNWVRTTGGWAALDETPQSTGKQIILKIGRDTIYSYENGDLKWISAYKIVISESGTRLIEREGLIRQSFSIEDDTLILREECDDCYEYTYTRID